MRTLILFRQRIFGLFVAIFGVKMMVMGLLVYYLLMAFFLNEHNFVLYGLVGGSACIGFFFAGLAIYKYGVGLIKS